MTVIFNPKWLIDPGPEDEQAIARELVAMLVKAQAGETAPISIRNRQIGSAALGAITAGINANGDSSTAAVEREVLRVFANAAQIQPPALRGAAAE